MTENDLKRAGELKKDIQLLSDFIENIKDNRLSNHKCHWMFFKVIIQKQVKLYSLFDFGMRKSERAIDVPEIMLDDIKNIAQEKLNKLHEEFKKL